MNNKVNHIALKVNNIDKAEIFYSKVLRLKRIKRCFDKDKKIRSVWFNLNKTILMIEKSNQKTKSSKTNNGWYIIAIDIRAKDRVKWKNHLIRNNVKILNESDYTIYFEDQEKNMLGLSHFPKK